MRCKRSLRFLLRWTADTFVRNEHEMRTSFFKRMRIPLIIFLFGLLLGGCGGSKNDSFGNGQSAAQPSPSASIASSSPTVNITTPDGVILVGTFLESAKPNSPTLLLLHQWQSDRHSYDDFAKRMQVSEGFNVLSIDGRGFGESTKTEDGKVVSAGRSDSDVKAMLGDVGAAFDFLAKQSSVDPAKIGIVGASYGGSLALIYAADNPKVAAVALLSPGLNYFGNMQTEPAIKKYGDRPLFLVAAEDDKESADAVRTLIGEANGPKYSQKVFAAGGHGTGLFRANVGLDLALKSFFTDRLVPVHN